MKKKNNKGFSLIETLMVIVILGSLLLIAISSISKQVTESRKKTMVASIESYINSATLDILNKKFKFRKEDVIYALPVECIAISTKSENEFKKIIRATDVEWAYVLIQYDKVEFEHIFGFTFYKEDGYGMYPTAQNKINKDGTGIKTDLKLNFPKNGIYTDLTDDENWKNSGFKITETTMVQVLRSLNYGVDGNGKTTCTLVNDDGTKPEDELVIPPDENPVDPPADDPIVPPEDDPVDPPEDDPVDPPEDDPVELKSPYISAVYLKGTKRNTNYPNATSLSGAVLNNGLKINITYDDGNVYEFRYCKNSSCSTTPTSWTYACRPTNTNKTTCSFDFEQDYSGYIEVIAVDSSGKIMGLTSNKFYTKTDVTAPTPTMTIKESSAGEMTVTSTNGTSGAKRFTVKEGSSITFNVTSNDAAATQKLIIDSVEYDATNKTLTKILTIGEHTVNAYSKDSAENVGYTDSAVIIVEENAQPETEGTVESGTVCNNRIENSICYFDMRGKTPDAFASTYSINQAGTVVYDFDVTIMFTTSGVNWQCYTGSNKGFNWFGGSLFGGYRCWEGSVCYNNLITQKGQTLGTGSVKDCDELYSY